ncbi:MAG TPA: type IV secretory system conjugative DNA transfer family protein [Verrucomicrobiae bacterium]|nr:type IV secretory system conjugative DNA transfer family protein [Verrucomicrobiae bacterium]
MQVRKIFREQKNFERGLKMVPLYIHLPPQSDDIDLGSRDIRDIADENISKAQILYNIIASSLQKGFKSKFYGQRHFTFEIVGSKGFVHFYAAVPVALVDLVTQAVISAYPAARLEEASEHNIFSPVGKISGTTGGEFTLKENYAYPIATYQDIKRDAMVSLLNALSTLEKDDGVGIQFLMRPANPEWGKTASAMAGKKRKGKDSKSGFINNVAFWMKQLAVAFTKPPEDKDKGGPDKPELSSLEQAVLDSIDDKTRYPGYEVLIRVIASSNISQRSQAILGNIIATFSLFDAPGKNGFKFTPARDIEQFATAYIMRFFPQDSNQSILNSVELATLFHFPDQRSTPTSQLERQSSKQVDGPRNVSDEGLLLGYNIFRGAKKPIRIALQDRQRHMYVVGQTGTGKSTFLENLALQDMLSGEGFAFVDPHGDTAEKLLSMVPRERTEDVVYFSPADMDYPMGLNLFEFDSVDQQDFLIQEAINMLYKLYDPQRQGIIGPRYEHWFRMAAKTVMANPDGGTFIDIPKVFTDNKYAKDLLKHVKDQIVLDFWNKEMAQTSDYHKSEVLGWFVSKFGAFMANEMMRNIIGQSKSSFNLREIMDNKKILLVNLSKGKTGDLNSKLLGMIFVMKFQAAAMSRANVPESERKDFCLYVDEFQNFSTDSFATIMSEARKYHLNLIVANQFTTQLSEEIRDAVFGNMGSIVAFRVGQNDVDSLTRYFQPFFDGEDLLRVPNANTVVRTLINGVPTQPFSMATLPPLGNANPQLALALKQLSAAKFGRPRSAVASDIFARLATKESPRPAFGQPGPLGPPPAGGLPARAAGGRPAPPRPAAAPGSGSFLDDWLAKRRTSPAPVGSNTPAPPASHLAPPQQLPQAPVKPRVPQVAPVSPTAIERPMEPPKKANTAHQISKGPPEPGFPPVNKGTSIPPAPVEPQPKNNSTGGQTPGTLSRDALDAPAPPQTDQPQIQDADDDEDVAQLAAAQLNPKKDSNNDDTIYIDTEGTLHVRGVPDK